MKKGDTVELQKQDAKVVECEDCGHLMVNLDLDQVKGGDLLTLKRKKVRISNPETKEHFCLKCDVEKKPPFRERLSNWFETTVKDDDDDDDSSFFSTSGGGLFGGSLSSGGFGGFGGGGFSGGGASRGF